MNLHKRGIDRILLMRFSASGRGTFREDLSLTQREVTSAFRQYKDLERLYRSPRVLATPSVRGEFRGNVFTSLNIANNGLLLSNPWSYDSRGVPKEQFVLGNLVEAKFSDLVGRNVYQIFLTQLRRNLR